MRNKNLDLSLAFNSLTGNCLLLIINISLCIGREGVMERYAQIGSFPQVTTALCKLFKLVVYSVNLTKFPPLLGPDLGSTVIIFSGAVIGGTAIGGAVIGGTAIGGAYKPSAMSHRLGKAIGGAVIGGTAIGGAVIGGTAIGGAYKPSPRGMS
jgi:hypothetical protein